MGFHDIENFNQALLCKQAWRIWSSPQSLLARVMKSRYFRRIEFLECAIGTRPSYAWRSIMHGRELLLQGLLKRVGNGRDTHVWYDNWILADVPRPPRYRTDEVDLTLMVSDLIDERYGSWNAERIRHLFVAEDAEWILNMKVNLGQNDSWVWGFSKNGSYNSQSGYKLIDLVQTMTNPTVPSLPPVEQRLWSNLWKVKTLPKIRHFLWRALAGALAVAERLHSRGIGTESTCKVCHSQPETICHILFHCPIAKEVWRLSEFPLPAAGFSPNSVFLNLHHLMEVSKKRQSNEKTCMNFPWILWHLWKARNRLVFEQVRSEAKDIWEKIKLDVEAWNEASKAGVEEEGNGALSLSASLPWQKPSDTFVKCNIGTSFINDSQNCGASWLVRDHLGKALNHSRRSYSAVLSSLEADLLGFAWAVESMVTMRYERVVFESSSYLAGEAILHPERFLQFQLLINQIRNQLSRLRLWSIAFVHKVGNRCAEEIATSVTRDQRYSSYIAREGPFWLSSWLQEEANQESL